MSVDYSTLAAGQQISHQTFRLDVDTVASYVEAVGDKSELLTRAVGPVFAPPMAVAALSLRGVVNDLAMPAGTLHAGQELEFNGAVQVGETLDCKATLVQNSLRGEWRYVVVRFAVEDGRGRQVMRGKSTMILPV